MSKPISISFGKSKAVPSTVSNGFTSKAKIKLPQSSKSALRQDSDDEEDSHPTHQSISAFEATGAVLSHAAAEKEELVIKNPGNGDWRRRGRGPTTAQVQGQQNGGPVVIEKDEVSKASGLQFAERRMESAPNGTSTSDNPNGDAASPAKPLTEDEKAMNALLGKGPTASTTIIEVSGNTHDLFQNETDDFRADVASRPDSCTLDEYAAMPVEEFGMALLRGMGQKRRANGEIIKYGGDEQTNGYKPTKAREPRQGYLGIGAKAAPGADTELGAWGKTQMRKNDRGEGFYTPVMLKDKRTGELITEDELERRKKESRGGASPSSRPSSSKDEKDWRERRDRNLERSGRDRIRNGGDKDVKMITNGDSDDYKEQMSGFSSRHSSAGQDRDRDGHGSDRSRKDRNRKKDRSRDRDRDRRRYDNDIDGDDNDTDKNGDGRDRERRKDRHRDRDDEKRNDSSSSRHGSGRRDRDGERDKGSRR